MGAVKDRSIITLDDARMYAKTQLGCTPDDFVLGLVLSAAKGKADYLTNNRFVLEDDDEVPILDEDTGLEIPLEIPEEVELWVIRRFARDIAYRLSGNNKVTIADKGSIELDPEDWTELLPYIKF